MGSYDNDNKRVLVTSGDNSEREKKLQEIHRRLLSNFFKEDMESPMMESTMSELVRLEISKAVERTAFWKEVVEAEGDGVKMEALFNRWFII